MLKGDIDGNGRIGIEDAALAWAVALGYSNNLTAQQKQAADVNNDGKVTEADKDKIMQHIRCVAVINEII